MKTIILASQSKQRKKLLACLGFPFETVAADIDELSIQDPDDAVRARKVAEAKAAKIRTEYPEAIIISADTFVVLDGERLEKPLNLDEARRTMKKLAGQTSNVYTGWSYSDPQADIFVSNTAVTEVTYRDFSDREIERYVTTFPVTEWAGSFSIIHTEGAILIADMKGSLTSVLGLPIESLTPLLQKSGILI